MDPRSPLELDCFRRISNVNTAARFATRRVGRRHAVEVNIDLSLRYGQRTTFVCFVSLPLPSVPYPDPLAFPPIRPCSLSFCTPFPFHRNPRCTVLSPSSGRDSRDELGPCSVDLHADLINTGRGRVSPVSFESKLILGEGGGRGPRHDPVLFQCGSR